MLFKDYLISIGVNPDVYLEMVKYRAKMFGYDDVIEISDKEDTKLKFYFSENFKIIYADEYKNKKQTFSYMCSFGISQKKHMDRINREPINIFETYEKYIDFEISDTHIDDILLYKKLYGDDCDIVKIHDIITKFMMVNNCYDDIFEKHKQLTETEKYGAYGGKALRLSYFGNLTNILD